MFFYPRWRRKEKKGNVVLRDDVFLSFFLLLFFPYLRWSPVLSSIRKLVTVDTFFFLENELLNRSSSRSLLYFKILSIFKPLVLQYTLNILTFVTAEKNILGFFQNYADNKPHPSNGNKLLPRTGGGSARGKDDAWNNDGARQLKEH